MAAVDLVAAAEAAQQHAAIFSEGSPADEGASSGGGGEPFVWRQPIMRPAVTAKQVRLLIDATIKFRASCSASVASHLSWRHS